MLLDTKTHGRKLLMLRNMPIIWDMHVDWSASGLWPGFWNLAGKAECLLTVCSSDMRPASFAAVKRMEKVVIDGCPPTRSIALYVCIPEAVSMSRLLVWM